MEGEHAQSISVGPEATWEMQLERWVKKGLGGLCVVRVVSWRLWKDVDNFSSEKAVGTHCRKWPGL